MFFLRTQSQKLKFDIWIYQILSEGAGGKFTLKVPLILCNWSCKVIFLLVIFFLTHSLSAILATKSERKIPSTSLALKPGSGGSSFPGVLFPDPVPSPGSSGKSSSSLNREIRDPDKLELLRKEFACQELLWNTSAESSSSLSSMAAWRLKREKKRIVKTGSTFERGTLIKQIFEISQRSEKATVFKNEKSLRWKVERSQAERIHSH